MPRSPTSSSSPLSPIGGTRQGPSKAPASPPRPLNKSDNFCPHPPPVPPSLVLLPLLPLPQQLTPPQGVPNSPSTPSLAVPTHSDSQHQCRQEDHSPPNPRHNHTPLTTWLPGTLSNTRHQGPSTKRALPFQHPIPLGYHQTWGVWVMYAVSDPEKMAKQPCYVPDPPLALAAPGRQQAPTARPKTVLFHPNRAPNPGLLWSTARPNKVLEVFGSGWSREEEEEEKSRRGRRRSRRERLPVAGS